MHVHDLPAAIPKANLKIYSSHPPAASRNTMRYLKLFGTFVKSSILVELEYRANFITQTLLSQFWTGITLLSVLVFYAHADNIGGWGLNEALVIVGMFVLMNGFIATVLQPNAQKVVEMIRTGTLDFVLTKPINSQFLSTLRYIKIFNIVDVLAGAIIIGIAWVRMGFTPTLLSMAQFALMFAMALLIMYSLWAAMATLSFWFVKIANLNNAFSAMWDTGRFPITTFEGGLRIALTFVLPIAFITTFPSQALLGTLDTNTMLLAVLMGLGTFGFSVWFWRYAVRSYSSASS